jgi:hypothetical protein
MTQQQLLAEYTSLPNEAQRQVDDLVAFLRQRYGDAQTSGSARASGLANEPFIGMWSDRTDLEDSTTWVRETRQAEWARGS